MLLKENTGGADWTSAFSITQNADISIVKKKVPFFVRKHQI